MSAPPVGAVLRVRYYSNGSGGSSLGRKHPWVIVEQTKGDELVVRRLFPAELGEWDEREILIDLDRFDVIPPEKWPKEVCVAVAKYRLLGEVT